MRKIIGIISSCVLLLVVPPVSTQAAILTLINPNDCFRVEAHDNDSSTDVMNCSFPNPAPASVTTSNGYASASASGSLTSSGLQFSFSALGYDGRLWSGASTYANNSSVLWDFIFFRVDSTPEDTSSYGKLNYSYSWNCSSNYGDADSLLAIKINDVDKLVGALQQGSGSDSGVFDVAIGDIIGVKAEAGGDIDGIGSYYSSGCSVSLALDGFVPLPSTLLLLGSGLLGIAATGWRKIHPRVRKK
jgi:hypothetical protein